jgi:hypothetical protein
MNPPSNSNNCLETMKTEKPPQCRSRTLILGLTLAMLLGLSPRLESQDAKITTAPKVAAPDSGQPSARSTNKQQAGSTNSASTDATAKQAKPAPKLLSGAELYSMHCARCHPERYPNERTSAQWKTIGMHMRVRANLPAEHYRKLLKYLQDNSGY